MKNKKILASPFPSKDPYLKITLALLLLLFFSTNAKAQSQLKSWVLPAGDLITFASSPVTSPLPTGGTTLGYNNFIGLYGDVAHNSMHDKSGALLFYVAENSVYDKDGDLVGILDYDPNTTVGIDLSPEIAIIPDIESCTKYYIVTGFRPNNNMTTDYQVHYAILELANQNPNFPNNPAKKGELLPNTALSGSPQGTLFPFPDTLGGFNLHSFQLHLAASKVRNITGVPQHRFIFIADALNIHRFILDASGITFDNSSTTIATNTTGSSNLRGEMELWEDLPNNRYRIATVGQTSLGVYKIFTAELNYATGNLIPGSIVDIILPDPTPVTAPAPIPHGIEFSPNGNYLYIAHESSNNLTDNVQYYNFSTGILTTLNIPNSANYQFSQIELGHNPTGVYPLGFVSGTGTLTFLNDANNPGTLSFNSRTLQSGITHMPDQIDGEIYQLDDVPPVAACLGVGVELDSNCMAVITPGLIDGGSFDNCQIQSMSVSPNVLNQCGLFPVTLTVTDLCGNTSTCMTSVQAIESIPPMVNCPSNITVLGTINAEGQCTAEVLLDSPPVTDNCDGPFTATNNAPANGIFPVGNTTVVWTVTDNCENVTTCAFTVTVTCDSCCVDLDAFCETMENAVTVSVDHDSCKATLNIGNLGNCNNIIEWVDWGDNQQDPSPGSMPMHVYNGSGTYIISWLAVQYDNNGQICFEKVLTDTITLMCDPCICEGFWDAEFIGDWGPISVICNNPTPVALPCPGNISWFHGNTGCVDTCLQDSVDWVLMHASGSPVYSGTSPITVFPGGQVGHFDIPFSNAHFAQAGTYMLTVVSHCNGHECPCKVIFTVPGCEPDCSCDEPLFPSSSPSILTLSHLNGCSKYLKPAFNLTNCDVVTWTYQSGTNAVLMGSTTGNAPLLFTFPTAGTYLVCMQIIRTEPNGTICEEERCQRVTINCGIPTLDCVEPKIFNPGFWEGALAGDMNGGSGQSEAWSAAFGHPVVHTEPGCEDDVFIELIGNRVSADGLSTTVNLEAGTSYALSFCLLKKKWSCEKKEDMVVRLSNGMQSGMDCSGECMVVGTYPLSGDTAIWLDFTAFFTASEAFNTLTLHLENASGMSGFISAYYFDNICIREADFLDATVEPQISRKVEIFPNPTTSDLMLRLDPVMPKGGQLQVLDLWGRVVQAEKLTPGEPQHHLSVEALPAGIYFIKVWEDGVPVWVEKVVKLY